MIFKATAQLQVSILRSGKWLHISSGSTYKLVLKSIEKAGAEQQTKHSAEVVSQRKAIAFCSKMDKIH